MGERFDSGGDRQLIDYHFCCTYFVIITREDLPNLPYSVEEIYGIHTAGKYHDRKKVCNVFYHIEFNERVVALS